MSVSAKAEPQLIAEYLDHPQLKPFVKVIKPGQYLFKQGDMGSTMFIVS